MQLQHPDKAQLQNAMLYMRPEAVRLWDKLDDSASNEEFALAISGHPGSGKSSTIWEWACWQAYNKQDVIWLNHEGKFCRVVNFKNNRSRILDIPEEDMLKYISKEANNSIKMIDALPHIFLTFIGHRMTKVVLVSSEGLYIKDCFRHLYNFVYHTMSSWTFEDYKNACSEDTFYSSIKSKLSPDSSSTAEDLKSSVINERFHYAGHCARCFFMNKGDLIHCINNNVQRVLNPASVVSKSYGNLAPMTVHHLSALINDKKTLVSSYVSRCLFDKISYDELQEICKVMDSAGNPVLNGIFFEYYFCLK